MIWRQSDYRLCPNIPGDSLALYDIAGKLEYVYESIDYLPSRWTRPQADPIVFGTPGDRDRAAAIIAAVGEWQTATKRAEDAAGYTEACEALDQAAARCSDLRRQIIFARARTSDGMMAKVRALTTLFPHDPACVEQRLQEAVDRGDSASIARCFGMSLALDAMDLRNLAPPGERSAA